MRSKVPFGWLSSFIKAAQLIFERFQIARQNTYAWTCSWQKILRFNLFDNDKNADDNFLFDVSHENISPGVLW